MSKPKNTRIEHDTMGEVHIPTGKLWGANTERARQNLPISDRKMPWPMLKALAEIKSCMANSAAELGYMDKAIAKPIEEKALEVAGGNYINHFPLDVFQTGSGTSSNMNVNEVVANLVNISLGGQIGEYNPVNPNDHVNFGQSSNDTIPSALHLGALDVLTNNLLPELDLLISAFENNAKKYDKVIKTGRTHLQDALPITFGHVFTGYAESLKKMSNSLNSSTELLQEIPLGGTAVGTGFQAPDKLPELAAEKLSKLLGKEIKIADSPLVYMAGRSAVSDVMGRIAALSAELQRIANDVRMMASGPRLGYCEITIPALQPGSSIMPGKVNPIVCESVVQVSMAIAGHHTTVLAAAAGGQFELNVTLPVTAYAFIGSLEICANVMKAFRSKVVEGIEVREDEVSKDLNKGLAIATALISKIGYAEAAKLAYKAHNDNSTVAEAAIAMDILKEDEVDKWLDPAKLVKRGRIG